MKNKVKLLFQYLLLAIECTLKALVFMFLTHIRLAAIILVTIYVLAIEVFQKYFHCNFSIAILLAFLVIWVPLFLILFIRRILHCEESE